MSTVIVFGALRSGTTLLRLMLNGHDQLSCTGEHDYLFEDMYLDDGVWRYDLEALAEGRIFQSQQLELPSDNAVDVALPELLGQIRGKNECTHSVLMLHRNLEKAISLLPDAPIVHFLRDPRDVAKSSVGMGWEGNVYFGADVWIQTETEWQSISDQVEPRSIDVRYEALVSDPVAELTRICQFLDIEYEEAMLSYPERSNYKAPDASLAEQWRKKMSKRDQQLIEARLGPLLTNAGYASEVEALDLSKRDKRRLRLQNAIGRHRFRLKRHGFQHIKLVVGRRLGLKSVVKSAKRKMYATTSDKYLR